MKYIFLDGDNIKVCNELDEIIERIEHDNLKLSDFTLAEIAEGLAFLKALEILKDEDEFIVRS